MKTFISETIDDILLKQTSFEDCVFVLPSQRAGVFVKDTLKNKLVTGFLPEILNIESFVEQISEISKADAIQLLFHFYTIYCEIEEHPDSFEIFSSWAFVVIQDFNEIDQYLINTNDIFTYLRDIQRMKKWSVKGEFKETELIKDHLIFMERLGRYYNKFYSFLLKNKIGYQGLMYREANKKSTLFLEKNKRKKFFFIGFNALNKSEELLFQEFLENGNSEMYWDIDRVFYESNHPAGNFIRRYKKNWKYYEKNELKKIGENFLTEKDIKIIGATKNVSQLKYAGEILEKLTHHQNTALVLGDESLLSVALNSIPQNVDAINITMGYPLQNVPTSQLISSIFLLFITQDKLQKTDVNEFYHNDVLRFFNNPIIFQLISQGTNNVVFSIQESISRDNRSFLEVDKIGEFLEGLEESTRTLLRSVFEPIISVDEFISRILKLIERSRDFVSVLEKEYLYRFHNAFTQLQNLNNSKKYFQNIKTLYQFYRRIIANEKLSFQGEPLNGLQLMGMLETRVLDFENIIITSVNENIIPSNSTQNSFIPFDIKVEFGLPTYREKDAIFSYHFFRLIQRAKNVYLIYNTENDAFGSGEKSRFISQLELMRKDLESKLIGPKIITEMKKFIEIKKNKLVSEKLKELAKKGISPSTITNYLYNPISFYKQKILKINEIDSVEETLAANTMGTVVHDVLEALYKPYINQFLTVEDIDLMLKQYKELVKKYFNQHFKNGDIKNGKNRIAFEVSNRFVQRFLSMERNVLKENHQVKILGTELELEATITIPSIDFPIKIKGIVDRIDELDGVIRIIDYKTGKVESKDLKILNFDHIIDFKYNKAIQVLLYAYLYTQNNKTANKKPIEAGIISFKNLKSGVLKMNFSSNNKKPDNEISEDKLEEFITQLKVLLEEIYNSKVPFLEPSSLPF